MKALLIKDELYWNPHWSVHLGKQFDMVDSSNNLLIFHRHYSDEEILNFLKRVPKESFELLNLEKAAEDECDFLADSGLCYRKVS